jgi:hypothetical protein
MGTALGLIGPLASIGGALFGGGSTANNVPKPPPGYQPTGQPGADQSFQQGNQNQQNFANQSNQIAQNLVNNPGAPGFQAGANQAGQMGQAAGANQFLQGQNQINQGNSVVPYAQQALQQGFDPQQAYYNQAFQQNTDQVRAGEEARGIDSTPYGAGVENDANRKFNTDWGFNQQQRQQIGAGTANSLFNQQNQDVNSGVNNQNQGANNYYSGSAMGYNAGQQIGQNQLGAINQGQQSQQQAIQDYLQYLQLGQGASGIANQQFGQNLQQNQQAFNQNQQFGQNLGAGLQGLQKGWQSFAGNSGGGGGFANNAWGQNNPGVAGSAYQGPVGP